MALEAEIKSRIPKGRRGKRKQRKTEVEENGSRGKRKQRKTEAEEDGSRRKREHKKRLQCETKQRSRKQGLASHHFDMITSSPEGCRV